MSHLPGKRVNPRGSPTRKDRRRKRTINNRTNLAQNTTRELQTTGRSAYSKRSTPENDKVPEGMASCARNWCGTSRKLRRERESTPAIYERRCFMVQSPRLRWRECHRSLINWTSNFMSLPMCNAISSQSRHRLHRSEKRDSTTTKARLGTRNVLQ